MTILFLLALFLAWPTYGLSIAVFGVFIVLRGYLIARANRMYANQSQAEQAVLNGARRLPTWAGNLTEIAVFKELQLKMTNRRGVSVHFVLALFADKASFDKLLFLAGAMEDLGASFNAQNVVVTDKIVAMWDHAPIDLKTRCIHQDQQSGDQSARPSTTKPARNRAGLMQAGRAPRQSKRATIGKNDPPFGGLCPTGLACCGCCKCHCISVCGLFRGRHD